MSRGESAILRARIGASEVLAALLLVSVCTCPQQLQAQESADSSELQEIVVTATRRSETNDKVPISLAVLNQETMVESGVKTIGDLAAVTPGIEFDNLTGQGAGTETNIAIRGIDSTVGASTTGIYLDDTALQSRLTSSSAFGSPYPVTFDLDRIEVLRGPQGTLFGAGAEGGAVRFISSEPNLATFSSRVLAEVAATRDGAPSYEAGVATGGPILPDELGFRVSLWHRTDGGYVDHVDPFTDAVIDSNANRIQSSAARLALSLKPVEGLQLTPSIYWQRVANHDTGAYFEYLSDPGRNRLENGRLLRQPSDDSFYLAAIKITAQVGWADFVSTTSYFDRHAGTLNDLTSLVGTLGAVLVLPNGAAGYGNPLGPAFPSSYADAAWEPAHMTQRVFAEEARLASSDPNARLSWLVGIYYSRAYQADPDALYAPESPFQQPGLVQNVINKDTQSAAFGQFDLAVISKLKLSLGMRIARLRVDSTQVLGGVGGGTPSPDVLNVTSTSATQTPVTPRFGVSYQYDDHNMYYLTVSKGYRLGGANAPTPPDVCQEQAQLTYGPDTVWSYEIGAKNRLFDGHLQLASSAFHIDWKNIQQNVTLADCGFQYTANTGSAVSNGFDLAAQALLPAGFQAGIAASYTDAHFTRDVTATGQPVVARGDSTGSLPQVQSPWNVTLFGEYKFTFASHNASIRAEDIFHSRNSGPFTSQIPTGVSYEPDLLPNPSTNLVNLRTTLSWTKYDVSLFVNNILNSHPRLGRYVDIAGATLFTAETFRPMTVGVNVNANF